MSGELMHPILVAYMICGFCMSTGCILIALFAEDLPEEIPAIAWLGFAALCLVLWPYVAWRIMKSANERES